MLSLMYKKGGSGVCFCEITHQDHQSAIEHATNPVSISKARTVCNIVQGLMYHSNLIAHDLDQRQLLHLPPNDRYSKIPVLCTGCLHKSLFSPSLR